jgi:hypothetical protein
VAKLRGSSHAVDEFASANAQAASPLSAARSAPLLARDCSSERQRLTESKAAAGRRSAGRL